LPFPAVESSRAQHPPRPAGAVLPPAAQAVAPSDGMMEYWNTGILGDGNRTLRNNGSFSGPIIP